MGGRVAVQSLPRRPACASSIWCAAGLLLLVVGAAMGVAIAALTLPLAGCSDSETLPGVRHLVLFAIKKGHEGSIVAAFDALAGELQSKEVLLAYERGEQNSPEGLDNGLTHAFTITFKDNAQRDLYLTHPLHLAFVKDHVEGNLDSVTVFDYEAQQMSSDYDTYASPKTGFRLPVSRARR